MTTFFLIRHAAHEGLGECLTGRLSGAGLGEKGRAQARQLGLRLKHERLGRMQASPRERASETADVVARACLVGTVETAPALDEVDFGSWTGKNFGCLAQDPAWRRWNERRADARTPGGESMRDVQRRVVVHMASLASEMPDGTAALVTHAEVIRAALLRALGLSLDDWPRIEIAPASISKITLDRQGVRVLAINEVVA
ncbi:MAG: histidine phosphatase family protein [Hyphomicrobiales bacterium]|nr:histidine phosphatase family protein [Hyphomicrobiales bacterium]